MCDWCELINLGLGGDPGAGANLDTAISGMLGGGGGYCMAGGACDE